MNESTDEVLQRHVAATCLSLADLLEGRPGSVWDEPSLCAGWRVREVVAHMTMPARYTAERFGELLAEVGFDFTVLSDWLALKDGQLSAAALVGNLRDEVLHGWTPPGGGWRGALNHAVIHSLDVTAAVGERRCGQDEAMSLVLDDLTAGGTHAHFGTKLPARTLRATDIEWSFGAGPVLAAPAEDIALHLCGRNRVALDG